MDYLEGHLQKLTTQDIQDAVKRFFNDSRKIQAVLYPEDFDQQ